MSTPPAEQWFVAVLVFESRVGGVEDDEPSVDVQYRLVRAVDAESAYQRAIALGLRERVSYSNVDGDTCEWRFVGLQDLRLVDDQELRHGSELYGFIEKGLADERVVSKDELMRRGEPPVGS